LAKEKLLTPNIGRDAAAFYDYVIEHYNNPPIATAFLHGHVANAWHTSCHAIFTRITRYYRGLAQPTSYPNTAGMITLTSKPNGDLVRDPFEWYGGRRRLDDEPKEAALFKEFNISLNDNGFNSCCGSFITLGKNFRQLDVNVYFKLREYVTDPKLDDLRTGRIGFEFIIYSLWSDPSVARESAALWYREADALANSEIFQSRMEACTSIKKTD